MIVIRIFKLDLKGFDGNDKETGNTDVAERWYFSIVDVVSVLTESKDPALYWRVLKKRLKDEGNETVTNCNAFKLIAADGKMRKTDVADQEQLFRLIQSIPSPKAEPFKQWMAQVASNRIDGYCRLPAVGVRGEMDQPADQEYRSPKGSYRRMGAKRSTRTAIRSPN